MNFIKFRDLVNKQFKLMSKDQLFIVDTTKNELWETYLNGFTDAENPIYKERTEHDCQCCKSFINQIGNVVTIKDDQLVSVWDGVKNSDYDHIANELSTLVKSKPIRNVFISQFKEIGVLNNLQVLANGDQIQWDHFYVQVPTQYVTRSENIGTHLSQTHSNKSVFERALIDFNTEDIETILELIDQNSLYRGEEHRTVLTNFLKHKKSFDQLTSATAKSQYVWLNSVAIGVASRIRSSVIGSLLVDLSQGKSLDDAIKSFESKVAPSNYKRPKPIVTQKQKDNAQKRIVELGIQDSLSRRFAKVDDVTINNVIFVDRTVQKEMGVLDSALNDIPVKTKKLDKVEEVSIKNFIENIVPKASNIELRFESRHSSNLMSLIAPTIPTSKNILKWNNNFSWAYKGDITDSMKQRVKSAGGNVDGVLRFSIQWNDGDNNQNDFDAHCIEPSGNKIYYSNVGITHPSSGILDVDIQNPGDKVAVENIAWSNKSKMEEGKYEFIVHNFAHNGGTTGFTAEIEYDGEIYSYSYDRELRNDEKVHVATLYFSRKNGIKFIKELDSSQTSKKVWNLNTNQFQNVSMIMNSPNHWDGNKTGNKHYFFIMKDCQNESVPRGFFNEFLTEELRNDRKVFEILGSKMRVEPSEQQLSGLGFSTTQRNSILCKVSGNFTRTIRIIF